MAMLNGQHISIEHLSVSDVGELLRTAFLANTPELPQVARLELTRREEDRLALAELQVPRGVVFLEESMGQILGMNARGAFARHSEACVLNFSYRDRTFQLCGQAYSV